jgi:hypothetical protein
VNGIWAIRDGKLLTACAGLPLRRGVT